MRSNFWHLVSILWLGSLYGCGIWLFSSGFLLHRMVIDRNSSCLLQKRVDSRGSDSGSGDRVFTSWHDSQPGCWFPPKFKRAIVLLIDGLRYDFATSSPPEKVNHENKYFTNKMGIFSETIRKEPSKSALFRFVADPPTTTLQRLKALTTGSLPTYIDLGYNFASYLVNEDNLMRQLEQSQRRVVFMGDDTWQGLYPSESFHRTFFFPSFNVKDLHTVDNGIAAHLIPQIQSKDWDVIIAHFLGVDHCGHRFGPSHPAMADKLTQMNSTVAQVLAAVREYKDTVVFVLGDHGMTRYGDHGGDTTDEVSSALFVYSAQPLTTSFSELLFEGESVDQVDFVPTFSLLLGIPIPFSNVGKVMSQLFSFPLQCELVKNNGEFSCYEDIPQIKALWTSIAALRINVAQIQRYLSAYHQLSTLLLPITQRKFDELLESYDRQWVLLHNLPSDDKNKSVHSLIKLRNNYADYLGQLKSELEHIWATYDVRALGSGLILLASTVLVNVLVVLVNREKSQLPNVYKKVFVGLLMGFSIAFFLHVFGQPLHGSNGISDSIFLSAITSILLAMAAVFVSVPKIEWSLSLRTVFSSRGMAALFVAIQFSSFFSNSSVVNEDSLSYFLVVTYILVLTVEQVKVEPAHFRLSWSRNEWKLPFGVFLVVLMILRVSREFYKCREEQFSCSDSILLKPIISFSGLEWKAFKTYRILVSSACLLTQIGVTVYWHRSNQLLGPHTVATLLLKYLAPLTALCVTGHWLLLRLEPSILIKHLPDNQEVLSKSANLLSAVLFAMVLVFPMAAEKGSVFKKKDHLQVSVALLSVALLIPLSLWLGDGANVGLFLIWSAALGIAFLFSRLSLDISWTTSFLWLSLSSYGFFASGHQTSIASIPWNAAFVGNSGNFTNYIQPALQVIGNMFASQIVFTCTLPLLVTLHKDKSGSNNLLLSVLEMSTLFENISTLYLQYLMLNGIKIFGVSMAATLLRRHLMVWKIFAPRFMFEVIGFGVTYICILVGYCFCLRVNNLLLPSRPKTV